MNNRLEARISRLETALEAGNQLSGIIIYDTYDQGRLVLPDSITLCLDSVRSDTDSRAGLILIPRAASSIEEWQQKWSKYDFSTWSGGEVDAA